MKLYRHIYIILSILSLVLAVSLRTYYLKDVNYSLYLQKIQQNFLVEINTAEDYIFEAQRTLRGNDGEIRFSELLDGSKYPFFIYDYETKELLFWSDHRFNVPYSDLEGYFIERCIETENAIWFVKKTIQESGNRELELITTIPLKYDFQIENKYLASRLNEDIFPDQAVDISLIEGHGVDIYSPYGSFLFSASFPYNFTYYSDKQWVVFFFLSTFALFLLFYVYHQINYFINRGRVIWAFWILSGFLLLLRSVMLYTELPQAIIDTHLFHVKTYAPSSLVPSLGDLLLNMIAGGLIIGFATFHFPKLFNLRKILGSSKRMREAISLSLVVLTYLGITAVYAVIKNIYIFSDINLDITTEINVSVVKIVSFLIFILGVLVYFAISHLASRLVSILSHSLYNTTILFVVGSLLYFLFSIVLGQDNIVIFNVNAIYFASITFLNFPQTIRKSNYRTFIYLFTCATAGAAIGSYAIYRANQVKVKEDKNQYAEQLVIENDPLGEFYLNEIMQKISNDPTVKNKFITQNFSIAELKRKVKFYIPGYFDKYDLDVKLYNSMGTPYSEEEVSYLTMKTIYDRDRFHTEYDNIYFINKLSTGKNRYLCMVPIERQGLRIGHILLDFELKKIVPNSIYPPFLDKKFEVLNQYKDFSYAIYQNNRLMYSAGEFNYNNNFLELFRHEKGFLKNEVETQDHHHLRVAGFNDKNVVITSEKYPFSSVFSNFSFLFLMLVFVMIVVGLLLNFAPAGRKEKINFSTKIQLYLNIALFLPLIVVSVITVSILSSSNQFETQDYYLEKAQSVSLNITSDLNDYVNGNVDIGKLTEVIMDASRFAQSDINIYDSTGRLLVASQEYVFENHLLAELINPKAYSNIVEKNQARMMLSELLGDLNFNSAYVGIRSPDTGKTLGIVSIPFFGSKYKFEQQVIELLTMIMKVFTTVFLFLLALSYFSVKSLLKPLVMVTQKIRKISLSGKNEPIVYNSDDEIGLLIGEYNKMLVKLEESKAALAHSEKESAWREMAKQVAHEIKNPLTPMRLTLQQLERVLTQSNLNGKANKAIQMLLEQIDTLNDITTSFSSFAKMPIPQEHRFEISSVLQKTISLYDHTHKSRIVIDIPKGDYFVNGDPQLMSRIFTNLILNGMQAVPEGCTPEIHVSLKSRNANKVVIEITDNGAGIPELIQNKIFVPNFSTKANGSGIGLAIAKRGIEHSGGNIWFETEAGRGTSFYIEMPLHQN